jgi:hypothetical protein
MPQNSIWPFPITPAMPVVNRENAMWIEVLSPHYQSIRADRVESVKVARNNGGDPRERYGLNACIGDREYRVSNHATQLEADGAAKELQIVLENS